MIDLEFYEDGVKLRVQARVEGSCACIQVKGWDLILYLKASLKAP